MKICIITRSTAEPIWRSEFKEIEQIPAIGEYVGLSAKGPNIYKVGMVLYTPFDKAQQVAEVYAEAVDDVMERCKIFPDMPK